MVQSILLDSQLLKRLIPQFTNYAACLVLGEPFLYRTIVFFAVLEFIICFVAKRM